MPMNRRFLLLGALSAALPFGSAQAHEYYAQNFRLIHPWADPTPPGVRDAAVYMRFEDIEAADRLVGASTPLAARVELRSGPQEKVDQTPVLPAFEVVPGFPTELARGQEYVLLRDLTAPLQWGRSYPLTLEFEKSGKFMVMISVGGA